jgi:hypothetical protein
LKRIVDPQYIRHCNSTSITNLIVVKTIFISPLAHPLRIGYTYIRCSRVFEFFDTLAIAIRSASVRSLWWWMLGKEDALNKWTAQTHELTIKTSFFPFLISTIPSFATWFTNLNELYILNRQQISKRCCW